jgi:hypothetical protein
MIEVKVIDWMPNTVMYVVRELRSKGYVQGKDFDFEYHKPKYDDYDHEPVYNRYTVFRFYKEELATWFSLTYT